MLPVWRRARKRKDKKEERADKFNSEPAVKVKRWNKVFQRGKMADMKPGRKAWRCAAAVRKETTCNNTNQLQQCMHTVTEADTLTLLG